MGKTKLQIDPSDTTDGRKRYQWKSEYPNRAKIEIGIESLYLFIMMICCFGVIYYTWKGVICSLLSIPLDQIFAFKKYTFYSISGLLGGVAFGMKYLYRTVARGWWHQDRLIWRLLSPFVAMIVAFIIGALIDASIIPTKYLARNATHISIGFLSGYFADQAVGKMYEIARVIFGRSAALKEADEKK